MLPATKLLGAAAIGAALCALTRTTAAPALAFRDGVVGSVMRPLEHSFPRPRLEAGDHIAGIIALGGSFERTREAVRLGNTYLDAKVIITGAPSADYRYARQHLLHSERLVIEPFARNTFENAVFAKVAAEPKPTERWLVVTSAVHMPRAIASFRGTGFSVEPWPIYDLAPRQKGALRSIGHEWAGLAYYRMMGRTEEFFPSPKASPRVTAASTLRGLLHPVTSAAHTNL